MTTQTKMTREQEIDAAWAQRKAQEKAQKEQAWEKADVELAHQHAQSV